jgi:hypothetical protein
VAEPHQKSLGNNPGSLGDLERGSSAATKEVIVPLAANAAPAVPINERRESCFFVFIASSIPINS